MKEVIYTHICRNCRTQFVEDHKSWDCPICHSEDIECEMSLKCSCGQTVYLDDPLTNECNHCGKLYNGCGQELAPPEEWDPEDKYACFGPRVEKED